MKVTWQPPLMKFDKEPYRLIWAMCYFYRLRLCQATYKSIFCVTLREYCNIFCGLADCVLRAWLLCAVRRSPRLLHLVSCISPISLTFHSMKGDSVKRYVRELRVDMLGGKM